MAKLYFHDPPSLVRSTPTEGCPLGMYEMQKIVSCRCSQCSNDITFVVPEEKIKRGTFPIILQNQHGIPPHKLMILINENFEVKPFAVDDVTPASLHASAILKELFEKIGISSEEQRIYFKSLEEKPIEIDEIAKSMDVSPKKAIDIAEKLAEKGFFKILDKEHKHFQPIPPYAAIIAQFDYLAEYLKNMREEIPKELERSFAALEEQVKEVQDPQEFIDLLKSIMPSVSAMINAILSKIFSKITQGTTIVGQFWDQAKRADNINQRECLSANERLISPKPDPTANVSPIQKHHPEKPPNSPPMHVKSPSISSIAVDPGQSGQNVEIYAKLDELAEKIEEFQSGNEVADYIQQLRVQFQKILGFVPTLNDMTNWANQLHHGFAWDLQGKEVLRKRVKTWQEKFIEHTSRPIF